jgi:hypothetical protein
MGAGVAVWLLRLALVAAFGGICCAFNVAVAPCVKSAVPPMPPSRPCPQPPAS